MRWEDGLLLQLVVAIYITVADAHVGCGWHHIHTYYSSTIAKVQFLHPGLHQLEATN
jgi:hypothetical protein